MYVADGKFQDESCLIMRYGYITKGRIMSMALIKCPECWENVSDKAEKCPNCGVQIKKGKKKRKVFYQNL